MIADPAYTAKVMTEILETIATHKGDARARVEAVYTELCFKLKIDDLPDKHKSDWEWIRDECVKRGPLTGPEGTIYRGALRHTMRSMKNSTAEKMLKKIYSMYWAVSNNKPYA